MAARKRSTFWLRVVAALVSMVIGIGLMLLATAGVFATATLGGVLFSILTWLAFGVAMSSGLFFTSDCLSEEKREGTLGFLFLTDLRGYDVAGGKLLATSLRGSFALLAVFPILAITLLMGGVTGVQFWQTTLALVNALFCSLAAGLFISAISRDPQKAMAGTLFLLVLWLAGGPLADAILAAVKRHAFEPVFSLSNPVLWLACRERWQSVGVWGMALLVAGVLVALLVTDVTAAEWAIWSSMSWAFVWLLYLWAASQACRFFIEARRSGLIELLMATPVSVPEIVQGQWRALLRMFGAPVVLLMAVQLAGVCFAGRAAWEQMASLTGNRLPALGAALLSSGASIVTTTANLVAISWFGMWMGMTSKSNNLATVKTIVFVQVIPGFAISFASALVIPLLIMAGSLKGGFSAANAGSWIISATKTWFPLISIALSLFLNLAKNIGFFAWSRRTLYRSFREQATRTLVPVPQAAPPRVPPPMPGPPPIPLQP